MSSHKNDLTSVAGIVVPSLLMLAMTFAVASSSAAQIDPIECLKRAAANEEKAKAAEARFSYHLEILVQTLGEAGSVSAELRRVSEMTYDDLGNRVERITSFPPSRLNLSLGLLQPDFKGLLGVDAFFLVPSALDKHSIRFLERQKLDELNTMVFEVSPAGETNRSKDYKPFKGKIWIDEQDMQMVKCEGRAVVAKDSREAFPKFEYYRENVERGLWLPSVALAKDVLDLKHYEVPIRIHIQYTSYKRYKARG